MATDPKQAALVAALAKLERIPAKAAAPTTGPGTQARARHAAYLAEIKAIGAQHAAAIKQAPGYHPGLAAFYRPADEVAFLNAQIEAARVKAPVAPKAAA